MKKFILCIVLILISVSCSNRGNNNIFGIDYIIPTKPVISDWDIFVKALIEVESSNNQYAVGKSNDVGILQITPIYVKEVNRISGKSFTLEDRLSIDKSMEMFNIMQDHYNPSRDINKAIKLHNPKAGNKYSDKIYNTMSDIKSRLL